MKDLNPYQLAALRTYADGDYAYIAEMSPHNDRLAAIEDATKEDPLLGLIMSELRGVTATEEAEQWHTTALVALNDISFEGVTP